MRKAKKAAIFGTVALATLGGIVGVKTVLNAIVPLRAQARSARLPRKWGRLLS